VSSPSSTANAADPASADRYNLVVIGGGPAGMATALGAAALGARVALVEKGALGGDSLHSGSVPSKALVRAARAAAEVRRAPEFGLNVHGPLVVDFAAVKERLERLNVRLALRNTRTLLEEKGIEVFSGFGRFVDKAHVGVEGRILPFSRAVIATGSRPMIPLLDGLTDVPFLTSDSLFTLDSLPKKLAVLGAGPVGCEMAQVFARFGSEVTVFEREERGLMLEDADAADIVRRSLENDGVTFRFSIKEIRFERNEQSVMVHSHTGDRWFLDPFDRLLVAAGRVPRLDGLNLEAAGIECDESGIWVDSLLHTTNPHVFAAGDVCSQYRYTHAADALARTVIANALFMAADRVDSLLVPHCTFTEPEIAHVGIHESDAQAVHLATLKLPFDDLDRAILDSGEAGLLKIHHDKRGTIRGATIVAANAGELISEIVLAMNHGVKLGSLASDIHPYPTQAEIIKRAGDQYRSTLLTPSIMKLLKRFLAWRR
jgi:pyruvate/2-oxoglutarate dehydrogenase complex dihydrolipoamide dehydrogenase (E3) component